RRSYWI
ncbi:bacterial regulatory helix-turn-helix, lysR family protein, partial [Vibrio harveyi]